ncbi:MAG TPA: hypothetical protein VFF30_16490 [Nitrososphaerales archaeon]|nr:hypothetical protein [Nitrososphaerales archaeon]
MVTPKISVALIRILNQFKPVNVPKVDKSSADISGFESFINECRRQFLLSWNSISASTSLLPKC